MTDTSEVTAGEYELVALMWDQQTSKPGDPFDFVRHRRGARVTLNVEDARRLVGAGAVVKPGARQLAAVAQAQALLQSALQQVPAELREQLAAELTPASPQPSAPPGVLADGSPSRPVQVAPKGAWVDFATTQGADRGEAEGLTKAELIDLYGA